MNILSYKTNAFGLDISDLSLKAAQVEKKGKTAKLISFGSVDMPKGIINQGEIQNEPGLIKSVQQVLSNIKGKKIKIKDVACSLPEEKSFLDVLQLPILPEEEIPQAVKFEAANHIPVPLEEVYFDFEQGLSGKKQQDVLIAATPKKIVNSYVSVLKKAGLVPQVMEIEPLSIVRTLIKEDAPIRPILVVDFGATRSSFIIFSGCNVSFSSTIPVSSNELTEVIAKKLKLTPKKAEKLKMSEGLEGSKKVFDAMAPVLNDFSEKIKAHLNYYKSHIPKASPQNGVGGKMDCIILCGAGAQLKGLTNFLTAIFHLDVKLSNPWVNIEKPEQKDFPDMGAESFFGYTTALGLALAGLKLEI